MDFIIKDFQSIKEARLRVEGFTILLGESSAGKSACMRALYAATNNRFKNGQVRYGEDHASVSVKDPQDSRVLTVVRPWNGSVKMKLGEEVFQKLGRTIPSQVDEFLNLGSLEVSDDKYSLNFHDQFQKPLLLEYSQKKVMDLLSSSQAIDDLNLTREALSKARSENKGAFNAVDAILNDSKAKLSAYKDILDKVTPAYNRMVEIEESMFDISNDLSDLEELCDILKELYFVKRKLKLTERAVELLSSEANIQSLYLAINSISENLKELDKLVKSISILASIRDTINMELTSKIENLKVLHNTILLKEEIDSKIKPLETKLSLTQKVKEKSSALKESKYLSSICENLELAITQRDNFVLEVTQLEEVINNHLCPICHSKLD